MTKKLIRIYSIVFAILAICLLFVVFSLIFKKSSKSIENPTINPPSITEITWTEAVYLIQECQIKTVFQKHNLEVTLTNKNNRIFVTKEPKIDEIFRETGHLRSDCNDIIQEITE